MSVQVLFLAANPAGTLEQHLGEEARAIHDELHRANPRAQLSLVPRLAARPLDLLRELRALRPAIVHFTGDAEGDGIWLVDDDGQPARVGQDALSAALGAAGKSVQIVVLSGCATDSLADTLCKLVPFTVWTSAPGGDEAGRAFSGFFYSALATGEPVERAYLHGAAAMQLAKAGAPRPQLRHRVDVDPARWTINGAQVDALRDDSRSSSDTETLSVDAGAAPPVQARPEPVYENTEIRAMGEQLEDARARKQRLRKAGQLTHEVDREILELRRKLRDGGRLRTGADLGDGRYVLIKPLGRGGFAVVWEAYDLVDQRSVAIKVLHHHLAGDEQRRERFFRGARVMLHLEHPAVVRVLDSQGEDEHFCYFVMEFMPGGNLRDAILEKRVESSRVLPLILQVGEALAEAHRRGLVHRDVKPQNILLDERGNAKLTDFDLVGVPDTTGGTRTGALGTVIYAAPECLDKPGLATARADVFGLGMTAIFCLSGQDLSMSAFRDPKATLAQLDCAPGVRQVLVRASAWEAGDRYADAAALVDALSEVEITGEALTLPPEEASKVAAGIRAVAELVELQKSGLVPKEPLAEDDDELSAEQLRDAWPLLDLVERSDGLRALPREDAEDFFVALCATDQVAILFHFRPGLRRQWMRLLEPDDIVDVIQEAGDEHRNMLLNLLNAPTRKEVVALLASTRADPIAVAAHRSAELPQVNETTLDTGHPGSTLTQVATEATRSQVTASASEEGGGAQAVGTTGKATDDYREGGTLILARPLGAPDKQAAGDACLVNLHPPGPDIGRRVPLLNAQYIVGRDDDAGFVVGRSSVSRQHARLYTDDAGNWWVEDLNSTNGTFVNEIQIKTGQLTDSDQVRFGDAIYKFLSASNVESAYHETIRNMAIQDGMTGIHNKRYFSEFLENEVAVCARHGHPLTLLMFDVDHFKKINDSHGHLAGDEVLKDLAVRIRPRIRREDLFARYGGNEFVCVLPSTALPGGIVFAEHLRTLIEERPCTFENLTIPFTISLGVTTLHREAGVDVAVLIKRAAENLYAAKRSGRNRVVPSLADLIPP